jgi:hypothetical protein
VGNTARTSQPLNAAAAVKSALPILPDMHASTQDSRQQPDGPSESLAGILDPNNWRIMGIAQRESG